MIRFISITPWLWYLLFFGTILYFRANYGHFPVYGQDPDLSAMGLEFINFISIFLSFFILAMLLLLIVLFLTNLVLEGISLSRKNRFAILFFLLGIILYVPTSLVLSPLFTWFFD